MSYSGVSGADSGETLRRLLMRIAKGGIPIPFGDDLDVELKMTKREAECLWLAVVHALGMIDSMHPIRRVLAKRAIKRLSKAIVDAKDDK